MGRAKKPIKLGAQRRTPLEVATDRLLNMFVPRIIWLKRKIAKLSKEVKTYGHVDREAAELQHTELSNLNFVLQIVTEQMRHRRMAFDPERLKHLPVVVPVSLMEADRRIAGLTDEIEFSLMELSKLGPSEGAAVAGLRARIGELIRERKMLWAWRRTHEYQWYDKMGVTDIPYTRALEEAIDLLAERIDVDRRQLLIDDAMERAIRLAKQKSEKLSHDNFMKDGSDESAESRESEDDT